MKKNKIIVVDYETGSKDPRTTEPIQLAAVYIDPYKMEVKKETVFNTLMKPENMESIEADALKVNGHTMDKIEKYPERSVGWSDFKEWLKQFNPKGSSYDAPIFTGYNVNFDWTIHNRLCKQFGDIDKKTGEQNLFSNFRKIDVMDTIWAWFENTTGMLPINKANMISLKLDDVRDFLGISKEGAHDAKVDVIQTGEIYTRFMKFQRGLFEVHGHKFKNSFAK